MTGIFLDRDSLDIGDLDFRALEASLPGVQFYPATRPEEVAERIAAAEVVISNKVVLDDALLSQARKLRLIAVAATGTNNVDLATARKRGIAVCNVTHYAAPSVVEHVFAMLLNLCRRLDDYRHDVVNGKWQQSRQFCLLDHPFRELRGRTLGIVGYGDLGQAVAHTAEHGFGMRVLLAQRPGGDTQPGRTPLDELLPQVDVLTLHCPLTEQTRGLIGANELALMKPDALLINTARGGIVDEAALADALRGGRLGGAGFDVLSVEPPRDGNPLLGGNIPHLILTPHIAWASREARQRLLDQVADNIRAFLHGSPRNIVN